MLYKFITWNMDWWKRSIEQRKAGWEYLQKQNCDFALLQETKPDLTSLPGYNISFHSLPVRHGWGTAIAQKGFNFIHHSFSSSYEGSPGLMCYEYSLPCGTPIIIINMYGKFDASGFCSTTIHHMIADITPLVFYSSKKYILLAGDLNLSEQWDEKYKNRDPTHKICFDRLSDIGLINVTKEKYNDYIQTHVNNRSDYKWQIDYFFINKKLHAKLVDCGIHNQDNILDLSDHFPLEMTADI